MAGEYNGFGTKIEYSEDDGTTWEPVGCIRDAIEVGPVEVEDIDVTCHSTTDDFRKYEPGLVEPGEVTFDVLRAPGDTSDEALFNIFGEDLMWKITYPNTATEEFNGYIKSKGSSVPMGDGPIVSSITIKITGKITLTPPAAPPLTKKGKANAAK
jgi:hypothetical protein